MADIVASTAVKQCVEALLASQARSATKYASDLCVIRATRRLFRGRIDKRDKTIDIIVKIGRPNYLERKFIKMCKKAKEPFPVKKIQLRFPPKHKA